MSLSVQTTRDDTMTKETVDSVYHFLGGFGRFQIRIFSVCVFICVTVGFQNVCPVFTLRTPPHRCRIPHLHNDSYSLQDNRHRRQVEEFIPLDEDGAYDECSTWRYEDDANATSRHKTACSSWVYDDQIFTSTLATDLNLVCDKKILRSTSSMLMFAGKFFGAILQGVISDRYGRRPCIIAFTICMAACVIGNGFVNSVSLLFALRFLTGLTTTAAFLLSFVLSVEFLEPTNRAPVSTILKVSFVLGQLGLAPFAYLLRDWRHFQLALTWPTVLAVIGLCVISESPRWLLSKGKYPEACRILRLMAKVNGRELPETKLKNVEVPDKRTKESAIRLFRIPRLAIRWLVLYSNWIVIVAVYYGITLNVSNMKGDIFVNFVIVILVDLFGTGTTGLVVNKLSRNYFHVGAMMASGLTLGFSFIPVATMGPGWTVILLSMAGKLTISSAFYLVYIYSAELFPTNHRSFGMGSCSMSGRLGGIAAPYLADLSLFVDGPLGKALPQIVFGVLGIIGGLAALLLPETRGRPLPESIDDAKYFGVKLYRSVSSDEKTEEDV